MVSGVSHLGQCRDDDQMIPYGRFVSLMKPLPKLIWSSTDACMPAYADAIFAGWHLCLRCRHAPVPWLGMLMTELHKNDNEVMKPEREPIEQLIGRTVTGAKECRHV